MSQTTPIAHEVNFDGIVGPTHSYAGLSYGNLASLRHKQSVSHPRQAALQGLNKMKVLADLGLKQAILPPHERPNVQALRRLGFTGSDAQILEKAHAEDPVLLAACCSASSMWAANAATISPSADTEDGRVHFTPANLITQFHRSLETPTTAAFLRAIFPDESKFAHHAPLPSASALSDEGAANHVCLTPAHGEPGIEFFVYGRSAFTPNSLAPKRYPARQTLESCATIARLHQLDPDRALLIQQNPDAIDAGAFHNDVVAVGNCNVLFAHERAFADPNVFERISAQFMHIGYDFHCMQVREDQVPLADAITSYLFNSQLVTLPDGSMRLIAPTECQESPTVAAFLSHLPSAGTPIKSVHFVEVRQSMRNGGGPACLRLRVVLTDDELARTHQPVFLTDDLFAKLTMWIRHHYREELRPADLVDPKLLQESRDALDALTKILSLGQLYDFQRA
jgi:succinylarginine dihydrolase